MMKQIGDAMSAAQVALSETKASINHYKVAIFNKLLKELSIFTKDLRPKSLLEQTSISKTTQSSPPKYTNGMNHIHYRTYGTKPNDNLQFGYQEEYIERRTMCVGKVLFKSNVTEYLTVLMPMGEIKVGLTAAHDYDQFHSFASDNEWLKNHERLDPDRYLLRNCTHLSFTPKDGETISLEDNPELARAFAELIYPILKSAYENTIRLERKKANEDKIANVKSENQISTMEALNLRDLMKSLSQDKDRS